VFEEICHEHPPGDRQRHPQASRSGSRHRAACAPPLPVRDHKAVSNNAHTNIASAPMKDYPA
jgi:hypothetical protein